MRWAVPATVLGVVSVVWGSAFVAWRWARRRLGLVGPDAPGMTQREKSVRRSLRVLLAFNFFAMWPVGLPSSIIGVAVTFRERDLFGFAVAGLAGWLCFTVAVPCLIRTAHLLERQRLTGEPAFVPPSFWIEGGSGWLLARRRRRQDEPEFRRK